MSELDDEIEARIRDFFETNFEMLRLEGGHSLSPGVKATALQQVLFYWRRLGAIASKVTDTEVRLTLPEQTTPHGRTFTIEGVVDIVREEGRTVMYDIKTHDVESIRANVPLYEKQLNVYAHIWQCLRGQELDETAVISTQYPEVIREAWASGDAARLEYELQKWNPLVEIAFNPEHVEATIREFGAVVDAIEAGAFEPQSLSVLKDKLPGARTTFAVSVCRNCDARFSCDSYRLYAQEARGLAERTFRVYLADNETDSEREERMVAALDAAALPAELEALL